MKKEALIKIKGVQTMGKDEDIIEVITRGTFYRKADNYYICYEESEESGFMGVKATVKVPISADKITLLRSKPRESQFIIEKDKRHLCSYLTEFGNFMIGVNGEEVSSSLNDNGGKVSFKYSLDLNSALASINQVIITVEEC